jgi:hypothetical protein
MLTYADVEERVKDHAGMLSLIRQHTSAYTTYAYVCLRMLSQVVATVRRRPQDLQDFCIPHIASQAVCGLKLLVYAALSY